VQIDVVVDVVHSIQQSPSQLVALLLKQLYTSCHFNHLLVIIIGAGQDHCSKCDADILVTELPLHVQHLPNDFPILSGSVSFKFKWMNYDPFDATLVRKSEGHSLGFKPNILHRFCFRLLSPCSNSPMLGNGEVILDEALPNIFITTTLRLPYIHHFYIVLEINQVATLQKYLCMTALLPMYSLL
jgi:hypothetical protein